MWLRILDLQSKFVTPNFGGNWRFKTVEGALVTIMIMIVTISYGTIKFGDLVDGSTMSLNVKELNNPDEKFDDSLTFADLNILIAFKVNSFQNYFKGNLAMDFDLEHISQFVNIFGVYRNGMDQKIFGLRDCTEKEMQHLDNSNVIISNGVE
jgi:hypothetical protein